MLGFCVLLIENEIKWNVLPYTLADFLLVYAGVHFDEYGFILSPNRLHKNSQKFHEINIIFVWTEMYIHLTTIKYPFHFILIIDQRFV